MSLSAIVAVVVGFGPAEKNGLSCVPDDVVKAFVAVTLKVSFGSQIVSPWTCTLALTFVANAGTVAVAAATAV